MCILGYYNLKTFMAKVSFNAIIFWIIGLFLKLQTFWLQLWQFLQWSSVHGRCYLATDDMTFQTIALLWMSMVGLLSDWLRTWSVPLLTCATNGVWCYTWESDMRTHSVRYQTLFNLKLSSIFRLIYCARISQLCPGAAWSATYRTEFLYPQISQPHSCY